jgi:zinc/manganese transport system permease protein
VDRFLEILAVMPAAFGMCLVLTGIHGYLGLHVLERKVIFVDLALAQIAALGAIYAMWLGFDLHGEAPGHALHRVPLLESLGLPVPSDATMVYLFSLAFAIGGAAVFAGTRMKREKVPQEAFIGITFATAVAIALLLLAHRGGGAEHVRNMLARDALMFASWSDVGKTGLLYGAIGVVHVLARRPFFRISLDPEGSRARGMRVGLWDFLFYATFGFVITSSVAIAGVLLVFSYLVVPAAIAVLFGEGIRTRVALAWGSGFLASVLGMLMCAADNVEPPGSPPGPWIVAAFSGMLLAAGAVRALRASASRPRAIGRLAAAGGLAGGLFLLTLGLRKVEVHEHDQDPILEALSGGTAERLRAIDRIVELRDRHYVAPISSLLRADPDEAVVEHAVKALAALGDPAALEALRHTAARDLDAALRVETARAIASLGGVDSLSLLLEILEGNPPPFAREEAASLFRELSGRDLDPADSGSLAQTRAWIEANGAKLRWNVARKRFE